MELSFTEFVWFVLMGSGGLILLLVVASRTLHARAESRSLAQRIICRLCLHAFEDHGSQKIVKCPQCGAANERGRSRQLG